MTASHKDAHFIPGVLAEGELVLQFSDFSSHPVHKVPTYFFRMVHAESGEELGSISLRVVSTRRVELYAGHIGYGVHPAHRGHRYAARSVRLLASFAGNFLINPLWITCDPDNVASRRTCELAGAKFVETVDVPTNCIIHRSGHTQKCRYRLDLRLPG